MNTFDQQGNQEINQDINKPAATSDNKVAALIHLAFFANYIVPLLITGIIGLIVIKMANENFSVYLNKHWREAINFNISIIIYLVASLLLCIVLVGIPLLLILLVYSIFMPIIASIKALDGQEYKYPGIIRFI